MRATAATATTTAGHGVGPVLLFMFWLRSAQL